MIISEVNHKIQMAMFLTNSLRLNFSLFKKKIRPFKQQGYQSYAHLFQQLSDFEQGLDELQVRKMPKKLQDFGRKFRRLYRSDPTNVHSVPMRMSQTFQFFVRKGDEMVFGTEEQQLQTDIGQLLSITRDMTNLNLNTYYQDLIPQVHSRQSLFEAIQQRFINLEERLSRLLFKDYLYFSKLTDKLSFLTQRDYRGDFKFQLVQNIEVFQLASECFFHCAQFNQLRSKMVIACEKIVSQFHQQLSNQALGRYLYCLALANRPLRGLRSSLLQFSERLSEHPLPLLFYMTISEQQQFVILKDLCKYSFTPQNMFQQLLLRGIKTIVEHRHGIQLSVHLSADLELRRSPHGGQLLFQCFLERYRYEYQRVENELMHHRIYSIQGKKFVVLDHSLISGQTLNINGIGMLYQQHFANQGTSLKLLNWPRMLTLNKRTLRDEYLFSKFKGIVKPKVEKVRFYD